MMNARRCGRGCTNVSNRHGVGMYVQVEEQGEVEHKRRPEDERDERDKGERKQNELHTRLIVLSTVAYI